jgi:hypothetical protein
LRNRGGVFFCANLPFDLATGFSCAFAFDAHLPEGGRYPSECISQTLGRLWPGVRVFGLEGRNFMQ